MARVIGEYRGCRVEMICGGGQRAWRYSVEPSRQQREVLSLSSPLVDIGPFESSAAAYQDAVRRINILTAAPWDHAV